MLIDIYIINYICLITMIVLDVEMFAIKTIAVKCLVLVMLMEMI